MTTTSKGWTDHTGLKRDGEVIEQIDVQHPTFGRVIATLYTNDEYNLKDGVAGYYPRIRVEVALLDKGQNSDRTVKTADEGRKAMAALRAQAK